MLHYWHDFTIWENMLVRTRVYLRRLLAAIGLLSVQIVLNVCLFILAIAAFSFLVKQIFFDRQELFDFRIFDWVANYVTPFNTSLMQTVTFLGTHKFLIPANMLLTAYFLFIRKHRWYSIKVASIALSSTAIMLLLKNIFSRQRPLLPLLEPALGYSFPSGHSMMSFVFYGLLMYLAGKYISNRWLKIATMTALLTLILLIGFSRIYLRVHYASDVLAGFFMGIAWMVFSIWILNRIERISKATLQPVVEDAH